MRLFALVFLAFVTLSVTSFSYKNAYNFIRDVAADQSKSPSPQQQTPSQNSPQQKGPSANGADQQQKGSPSKGGEDDDSKKKLILEYISEAIDSHPQVLQILWAIFSERIESEEGGKDQSGSGNKPQNGPGAQPQKNEQSAQPQKNGQNAQPQQNGGDKPSKRHLSFKRLAHMVL